MDSQTDSLERDLARRQKRLEWWRAHVLDGPRHPVYRAVVVAWTVAILARATLAQVSGPGWWTAQLLLFTGAALLLRWGGRLGWFVSLVGLLIPLLFLRCWMTQTTLLAAIAAVGALTARGDEGAGGEEAGGPKRTSPEEPEEGEGTPEQGVNEGASTLEAEAPVAASGDELSHVTASRAGQGAHGGLDAERRPPAPAEEPPVVRFAGVLVICTYVVAVFHKLNRDYFDPEISCAVYGWQKLDRLTPVLSLPDLPPVLLHIGVLAAELLIAVLLWRRAMRSALVVGALFHLPLTIALAPAFVFTMGIGYAARMRAGDVTVFLATLRRHGAMALAVGVAVAAFVTWTAGVWPIWHLLVKIVLLVAVAVVALRMRASSTDHPSPRTGGPGAALPHEAQSLHAGKPSRDDSGTGGAGAAPPRGAQSLHAENIAVSIRQAGRAGRRRTSPWGVVAVGLMVALASTPYLGTRVQHAGAMLSNLRIDEGCWNHLLVPEGVRRVDPYVRVEVARVGGEDYRARGLHERREAALLGGLWGDDALRAVRRNWCRPHTRPIRIAGTLRGEGFVIEDLCDEGAVLPTVRGTLGGRAWFPGHLRFQTTLSRECRQVCVH